MTVLRFVAFLLATLFVSPHLLAQQDRQWRRDSDQPKKLGNVDGFNKSSKGLNKEVAALMKLVDVNSMATKVNDEVSLSSGERRALKKILKEFMAKRHGNHRRGDKGHGEDDDGDDSHQALEEDLEEALGDKAGVVMEILELREQEIDEQAKKIEEAASHFEKLAEEWAEKHEGQMEEWAEKFEGQMEEWGEKFEGEMGEWGENQGQHWEEWAKKYEGQMEEWAHSQEHYWREWGDKYGERWEEWAEKFKEGEMSPEQLSEMMGKNLEMLGEMPIEEIIEGAMQGAKAFGDFDMSQLDGLQKQIQESIEKSLQGMENMQPEELQESILKDMAPLMEALESMQSGLDKKSEGTGEMADRMRERLRKRLRNDDREKSNRRSRERKDQIDRVDKERRALHQKENEIQELREQIEALKRELDRMKGERSDDDNDNSRRRKRNRRDNVSP